MIELRVVRLLATFGFFAAVTLLMVTFAGSWGYVGGAVLFGGMTGFLWWSEVRSREQAQIQAEQDRIQQIRQTAPPPPQGPSSAQWS